MATDRFFVKNITLENFRCFEKVELGPFDPHFNLLVGTNGSGKSSVLLALANLFRPLARGLGIGGRTVGERDVRIIETSRRESNAPFARAAPWRMRSEFCWKAAALVAEEEFGPPSLYRSSADVLWRKQNQAISDLGDLPEERPGIIALYTTDRRFRSVNQEENGDRSIDSNLHSGAANWFNAGVSADALREWMRQETLIGLQDRYKSSTLDVTSGKSSPAKPFITQLDIVQGAICNAVEGAKSVEYVERRKDIVVEFGNGSVHEFSKMSDGQRALVGLVADIVRRACTVYDRPTDFGELETSTGLVLIDELDLHLHPSWQRRIISDLKRIFPNIQFFATTHSPQIIGEAKPEEIVVLTPSGQKRPTASYGMNSDWVLECVMEAEGRDPEIGKRIKMLFEAIENSRFEEARAMIAELRNVIGEAPDIVAAESYIWNLEHDSEEAAE